MAIYRGTGSTGTGGESDFAQLAQDAEAAAAEAAASADEAAVSEANADISEANALTSANNAASSASAASASATNAANSATAASGSASSASTSATNAAASATSASNSASAASTSATNAASSASTASTAATNASNSATSASTSATSAGTSATNAASSATAAANSASSASTSASTATTQATNAANSASAASTSASNAATSATNSANSATAAAASAAEAAATVASKVTGPASATDNAVARFDLTTGKIIQNSVMTIADDGASVLSVNSASDALRITQTGSGNALVVEDSANPDSTPFVIQNDGRTLVGSATSYNTKYNAASFAPGFQNYGVSGTGGFYRYTADPDAPSFIFSKSRDSTLGVQTIVGSSDSLGYIGFAGSDGTSFITGATIVAQTDGTPGTNDMPGRLVFSTTADGASSPTERMRIDNAGQVSIGGAPLANATLRIAGVAGAGTQSYGMRVDPTVPSSVTTEYNAFYTNLATQATAFTLTALNHYYARQSTIGAGSTVTNQYGFTAASGLTGATNNYGFFSNIASGTGRWNFYAAGSADNYFAGNVGIATTPTVAIDIGSTVGASQIKIKPSNGNVDLRLNAAYGSTDVASLTVVTAHPLVFHTFNTERMRIDSSGNIIQSAPTTAPTLSTNGTMVFNLTSNTNLRVSVRGSDGVTRTANITLA